MYKLELEKVVEEIKNKNSKKVLIQLPDGLKKQAEEIVDYVREKTDAEVFVWLSSCYGACDLPLGLNTLGVDLLVQFGHNKYHKTVEW